MVGSAVVDHKPIEPCVHKRRDKAVSLESVDDYVRKVKADINRSKARAANIVAYILVIAVVLSLPLSILASCLVGPEYTERVAAVVTRWYDIVAPLFGAVIGALFGIRVADRSRGDN